MNPLKLIMKVRELAHWYAIWGRFKKNWRNPDMSKLLQREFWMPMATALVVMANRLWDLGLSEQDIAVMSGLVVTAVIGLLARKKIMGEGEARN